MLTHPVAQHTPGPWVIAGTNVVRPTSETRGEPVADIHGKDRGIREATARLIAAAPELLAALKELVASLDERDIRMMALTRCRQAIAAAERRQV